MGPGGTATVTGSGGTSPNPTLGSAAGAPPSVGGGGAGGTSSGAATYLKASNTGSGDLFGVAVALSADGNTLAIGANREGSPSTGLNGNQDDDTAADAGALYVFFRSGNGWRQQAYVKASNTDPGDGFGSCAALSRDGNTLAVCAPFEASSATGVDGDQQDDSMTESGAVYVFVRNAESWEQQAYLKASNTNEWDTFGFSIALSADGNTLAVGANSEDGAATGIDGDADNQSLYEAGAVFVFERTGESWQQAAYVKASNTDSGDHFGDSVALSSDGNTLAVGASFEDGLGADGEQQDDTVQGVGAVYVFERDGVAWQQQAYLKPAQNDGYGYDAFGSSVSLSADGNVVAIGAAGDNSSATGIDGEVNDNSMPFSGAAYVFERTQASWAQVSYLKASNTGAGDEFGHHLSLSADGATLAVGAALEASAATGAEVDPSDNSSAEAGAVYLFTADGDTWTQRAFIKAFNGGSGDRFGWSVSLSADANVLAVGASREASAAVGVDADSRDGSAPRAGAAYVYELSALGP